MLFVSAQVRSNRLAVCRDCEHYVQKTASCGPLVKEMVTDSPLCGCFMPAKARFKVSSCPLDKWPALITPDDIETIREFLERDNRLRTAEELTTLVNKYLGPGKQASRCAPCNAALLKELQRIVNHADTNS